MSFLQKTWVVFLPAKTSEPKNYQYCKPLRFNLISEHKTTEQTLNLFFLCSLSPRSHPGSDGDNTLHSASCHAGARLFRSPGISLTLHSICGVCSHGWVACCACIPPVLGPPHPACLPACCCSPTGSQDTQGTTLSGTREEQRALGTQTYLCIIFSLLHPPFLLFLQALRPLCRHFSPFLNFSDRLKPLLWWMSLIISFQSQEVWRGGSQFRSIALTGETVSPWLPRGNGAEMDSCYKHRGGDNWWCLLVQWLHPPFPLLVDWAQPLQGPRSASFTKPAQQTKCHGWSAPAIKKYGPVLLSCCYWGSVFLFLFLFFFFWVSSTRPSHQIRGCSPICPHCPMLNTGRAGGQWDATQNDESLFNLWLHYSKKQQGTCIREDSDKEQVVLFLPG